jgi:hypothetical protein
MRRDGFEQRLKNQGESASGWCANQGKKRRQRETSSEGAFQWPTERPALPAGCRRSGPAPIAKVALVSAPWSNALCSLDRVRHGERWTRTRAGQIRYASTNMCAQVGSDGHLRLAACNAADGAQLFSFSGGRIQRLSNGKCLDVYGPSDAQYVAGAGMPWNGSFIQEFTCNSSLNQKWNFSGALRFGANSNLCLSRGWDGNGSALSLAACTGAAEAQVWDYYF